MQTATRTPSRNGHAEAAPPTQRITRRQLLTAQRAALDEAYECGIFTEAEYRDRLKRWQEFQRLHAEAQAVASTIG